VNDQSAAAVLGIQRDLFETGEDLQRDPLVAAVADRGGRAGHVGDGLIRAVEPQGLDEFVEYDPVVDASVAAQWMGGVEHRGVGSSAANWSKRGRDSHDGRAGMGTPGDHEA
jgi:hypothetical protein